MRPQDLKKLQLDMMTQQEKDALDRRIKKEVERKKKLKESTQQFQPKKGDDKKPSQQPQKFESGFLKSSR